MRSVYAVFDLEDHVISIAQAAYNDNHAVVLSSKYYRIPPNVDSFI